MIILVTQLARRVKMFLQSSESSAGFFSVIVFRANGRKMNISLNISFESDRVFVQQKVAPRDDVLVYRKNRYASDLLAVRKLCEKKLAFCFVTLNLKYEEVSSLRE